MQVSPQATSARALPRSSEILPSSRYRPPTFIWLGYHARRFNVRLFFLRWYMQHSQCTFSDFGEHWRSRKPTGIFFFFRLVNHHHRDNPWIFGGRDTGKGCNVTIFVIAVGSDLTRGSGFAAD